MMDATERAQRLSAALQFYRENQDMLVERYAGRYLLISDGEVLADFEDKLEALKEVQSRYADRAVLIQQASAGEESFSQTFHSRVAVARTVA